MYLRIIKPLLDFFLGILGIIIISPIMLVVYLTLLSIHLSDPIFIQNRIGQDGRSFGVIKFKTIKDDSRPHGFLKFLRKTKIDELPQLINVIKGDMSLVGPRPDLPGYYDELTGENRRILDLKPGITGYASIKFANEEEILAQQDDPIRYNDDVLFPQKVAMNLQYRQDISFGLDIKILIKTLLLPFK